MPVITRVQKAVLKAKAENMVAECSALLDTSLSKDAKARVLRLLDLIEESYNIVEETED